MDLSRLSCHRSCSGQIWEVAVVWAPAYSAVYLCLCLVIKCRVLQYSVIFFTPWKHSRVYGTHSHVSPHRLTSTTQPLCHCARVYRNIQNGYKRIFSTPRPNSPNDARAERPAVASSRGRFFCKSMAQRKAGKIKNVYHTETYQYFGARR